MNFGEALTEMKAAKYVRRKSWQKTKVIYVSDNKIRYTYNDIPPGCSFVSREWEPKQEDILAEDWEVATESQNKGSADMNMLLCSSLLMFFYALENLHNEKDTYSPFCGKNRD